MNNRKKILTQPTKEKMSLLIILLSIFVGCAIYISHREKQHIASIYFQGIDETTQKINERERKNALVYVNQATISKKKPLPKNKQQTTYASSPSTESKIRYINTTNTDNTSNTEIYVNGIGTTSNTRHYTNLRKTNTEGSSLTAPLLALNNTTSTEQAVEEPFETISNESSDIPRIGKRDIIGGIGDEVPITGNWILLLLGALYASAKTLKAYDSKTSKKTII